MITKTHYAGLCFYLKPLNGLQLRVLSGEKDPDSSFFSCFARAVASLLFFFGILFSFVFIKVFWRLFRRRQEISTVHTNLRYFRYPYPGGIHRGSHSVYSLLTMVAYFCHEVARYRDNILNFPENKKFS